MLVELSEDEHGGGSTGSKDQISRPCVLTIGNAISKLTYKIIDELELASENDVEVASTICAEVASLGPAIQLARASNKELVGRHLSLNYSKFDAVGRFLNCPDGLLFDQNDTVGLMSCSGNSGHIEELMQRAFMAVCRSTLPRAAASQAVAALGEFESNVHDHSGNPTTGVIGYELTPKYVGLFASDIGMGVLESLKSNPQHQLLDDAGDALQLSIKEGVSRFETPGHGNGFRPIFSGLANHTGFLRFRSGNAVMELSGFDQHRVTQEIKERAQIKGLHVFVHCRLT